MKLTCRWCRSAAMGERRTVDKIINFGSHQTNLITIKLPIWPRTDYRHWHLTSLVVLLNNSRNYRYLNLNSAPGLLAIWNRNILVYNFCYLFKRRTWSSLFTFRHYRNVAVLSQIFGGGGYQHLLITGRQNPYQYRYAGYWTQKSKWSLIWFYCKSHGFSFYRLNDYGVCIAAIRFNS